MYQIYSFFSTKIPKVIIIKLFVLLQEGDVQTQKKLILIKSIFLSLPSESKNTVKHFFL